jgi:hypothetical protein
MEVPMSRRPKALSFVPGFLLLLLHSTAFGSSYKAAGHYAVGNHPVAIAAGDFRGDGRVDLVVANSGSKTVSVLLGNGDGTFGKAAEFAIGVEPAALAVTDFNGDGRVDIVVADARGENLSVLLGNGDGSFEAHIEVGSIQAPADLMSRMQPQSTYRSGRQTTSAVFADFNGDGLLDEAVAMSGRNMVSVLLNINEESAGSINLIKNGGFETGSLLPWYQGRDGCSGTCKNWAVLRTDPKQGHFDAGDQGNIELRQDFAATPTSSIASVTFYLRHPAGAVIAAIDFFYSNGDDDEYAVDTTDSDWDSFNVTADLISGEELSGFSIWGYSGPSPQTTYVDAVAIVASN